MADLHSIDLTVGQRFERSLQKYKVQDRGTHRLGKGEVPHFSLSYINNDIISTSTSNNIITNSSLFTETITTLDLSDWVVNNSFTDQMVLYAWNEGIFNTNNITSVNYNNTSSKWTYYTSTLSTQHTIFDKLKVDPFINNYSDNSLTRLKHNDKNLNYNDSDIITRLKHNYHNSCKAWTSLYRDNDCRYLLYDDNDNHERPLYFERSSSDPYKNMENNLKRKAPFIKRVYVTRNGSSFDSDDFRFDMIKAQENFNQIISRVNI